MPAIKFNNNKSNNNNTSSNKATTYNPRLSLLEDVKRQGGEWDASYLNLLFPEIYKNIEAGKYEDMNKKEMALLQEKIKRQEAEKEAQGIAALESMNEEELTRKMLQAEASKNNKTQPDGPEIVMKKKPEPPEDLEDDRPKGLKDFIIKAFEDPEAIQAFGRALVEGKGISGGLEEYSEEREEGEKEQAALDAAAADLAFEKQKAEVDALYKAALSEQALAQAEKSQLGPNEIQIAQAMAMKAGNPAGTPEEMEAYNKAFFEALQTQITSKKDTGLDLDDTIKILALTNALTPEKIKELFPIQGGGQATGTAADNVIFAEGVE
jgi:hypothetical protein